MPCWDILGVTICVPSLDDIINVVTNPITQFVLDTVYTLQVTLTPLFDNILSALGTTTRSTIFAITLFFQGPLNYIQTSLETVGVDLSALGPQITAQFETTWTNLTSLSDSIVTEISTRIENIDFNLSGIIEGVRAEVGTTLQDFQVTIGQGLNAAQTTLLGALDATSATLTASFEDAFNIVGSTVGGLFTGFGIVDLDMLQSGAMSTMSSFQSGLASLAVGFSPMTPSEAHSRAEAFKWVMDAAFWSTYGLTTLIEAVSLGQVDITADRIWHHPAIDAAISNVKSVYTAEFQEGFYPILQRYWRKQFTPLLPAYADMIRIYVKEGYLPEKWVELPAEFTANMTELGYTEFWTQRLWGAHWVLPAVSELYEMYHRTLGTKPEIGVDLRLLRTMLKYHDFEPEWRDRLEAITWSTWRIYDLRRGWEMNILSDDELIAKTIDSGYSPAEAPDVAEVQKMFVLRPLYDKLITEAETDFRDGWINETTLRLDMEASPLRSDLIDLRIARAKKRRERDLKKDWQTVLRTYALKGLLALNDYATELSRLDMVEESVAAEVEDVRARRAKLETIEAAEAKKDLPYERIIKIWKVLKKSDDYAIDRLTRLGYSAEDAKDILDSERGD